MSAESAIPPLSTRHPWKVLGISRTTFFEIPPEDRPKPAILGGKVRPVYLISELKTWLESRKRSRRVKQPPQLAPGLARYRKEKQAEKQANGQAGDHAAQQEQPPAAPDATQATNATPKT